MKNTNKIFLTEVNDEENRGIKMKMNKNERTHGDEMASMGELNSAYIK